MRAATWGQACNTLYNSSGVDLGETEDIVNRRIIFHPPRFEVIVMSWKPGFDDLGAADSSECRVRASTATVTATSGTAASVRVTFSGGAFNAFAFAFAESSPSSHERHTQSISRIR